MPKQRVTRHEVIQPLDKSYRLIPLTQEQNAIVDVCYFDWLSRWNWFAHWKDGTKSFYAERGIGTGKHRKCIAMHTVILNCNSTEMGDHKNGNTLDNRIDNLRKCNHAQNTWNRKKNIRNKSGFIGVHLFKNRWKATISIKGNRFHVGYFDTPEQAAKQRDKFAIKHYGEFANLNFHRKG